MIALFRDWQARRKREKEEVQALRAQLAKEKPLFVEEARLCTRAYIVVLAQHFETAAEAKATAERIADRLGSAEETFTVMEAMYDISPLPAE